MRKSSKDSYSYIARTEYEQKTSKISLRCVSTNKVQNIFIIIYIFLNISLLKNIYLIMENINPISNKLIKLNNG